MKYQPPKGTQDLWGDRFYAYQTIAQTIIDTTEQYGFRGIRTPGFETLDILLKNSGSEVADQIYTFKDKTDRLLGIKSDITPAITRFIASNSRPIPKPIKVVSFDRVYRYESPQSGRNREITQVNTELFGARTGLVEAELLACMYDCYVKLGLPEVIIEIGYRPLLDQYVRSLGVAETAVLPLIRLIDKKDKITNEVFAEEAGTLGVDAEGLKTLKQLLDLQGSVEQVVEKAGKVLDDPLFRPYVETLKELALNLKSYGVLRQCRLNLGLARGSDYYTGAIWEAKFPESKYGSIGGGGRYDNLVKDYGGPDTSAIGWSIGIDRIYLVLEELGRLTKITKQPKVDYYVVTERDRQTQQAATSYAQVLRTAGKNVEIDLLDRNVSEQLQAAKELQVEKVLLFKTKDCKDGRVKLLDLTTNEETELALQEVNNG